MGSDDFRPPGPIQYALLQAAATPDDGVLPDGRVDQVDLSHWQRMGLRVGDMGWPTTWDGWSDLAGELKGDGWPDPDLIQTAQAQSIHIRIPPGVKVNVWPGWGWQQLWFDFDIREITDQAAATALGHFVHILGEVTQQVVLLSYEGSGEHVFARYNSLSGEMIWP